MEMIADHDVYIMGDHFLEDGQLLIENDFTNHDRRQIFTLDDMPTEVDDPIGVDGILIPKVEPGTIKMEAVASTSDDFDVASHFMSAQVEPEMAFTADEEQNDKVENGFMVEHMDIREPVNTLRPLLEKRLGVDLSDFEYWLQNAQKLDPAKNLVEQCIQGEGLVQMNLEIVQNADGNRINIVDVLKPTEDFLQKQMEKAKEKRADVQWVVDYKFQATLQNLQISSNSRLWTKEQVKHWIVWAVRQFNLPGIKLSDWNITGRQLSELTFDEFQSKCSNDKNGTFWTHLELLRRCNVFAVLAEKQDRKIEYESDNVPTPVSPPKPVTPPKVVEKPKCIKPTPKRSRILGCNQSVTERKTNGSIKSGSNGQIQLWQFLLELLTDKNHQNVIHWISSDGQFLLKDPETVARLWGERKHKPSMTYEKLSRALRYYYDGDLIAKVQGKRFVYQFVCDLKVLLGYTPLQLYNLVSECAVKNNLPAADVLFS